MVYKSKPLSKDYVVDLLVVGEIIVELKSVEKIYPVHCAQLLSYLRLTDKRLGLLINFNVPFLVQGLRRAVNKFLKNSALPRVCGFVFQFFKRHP